MASATAPCDSWESRKAPLVVKADHPAEPFGARSVEKALGATDLCKEGVCRTMPDSLGLITPSGS
jgi:hypothetical protein